MEFLVESKVKVPTGTAESEIKDREQSEAVAAAKLSSEGHIERLWKQSERSSRGSVILGLYCAKSASELKRLLSGLPLYEWMEIVVTRLDPHPNDPAHPGGHALERDHIGGRDCRMARGVGTEYLVTMTTEVPMARPPMSSTRSAPERLTVQANWRRRGICFAFGARLSSQANGARSACSPLPMMNSSRNSLRPCHCGSGVPTHLSRSGRIRTIRLARGCDRVLVCHPLGVIPEGMGARAGGIGVPSLPLLTVASSWGRSCW